MKNSESNYDVETDFRAELYHIFFHGERKRIVFREWAKEMEYQNKLKKLQELEERQRL